MTPMPELAADSMSGAAQGETGPPAAANGPFVLNLCSSSTPMALAQTELPELKRFNFFVSRRFEEGRERFRLHMGYFATLAEAEEWLNVVREIYPGAWAGEAPGRKLRERAAAAAADQARHAAGPQVQALVPPARPASPAPAPPPPPSVLRVPVVHAAPPFAQVAPRALAAALLQPARPSGKPAAAPTAAPPVAQPAQRTAAAPPPRSVAAVAAQLAPRAATPVAPRPAAAHPPQAAAAPVAQPVVAPPARPVARGGRGQVKQVFEDSNVREVLRALGDASATGETRQMQVPPPPRETTAEHAGLSDTQVLKLLETRRAVDSEPLPADMADGGAIPLLKPDDTGTRRALKEAVASNAPVAFAVQLQWSVQPAELHKVPPLAIFSAYTLYTVEGSRDGRKWYGLRLGFFSDAISAKQVAYYVRSEFASVAVVPVSPQERDRATEDNQRFSGVGAPRKRRGSEDNEFKLIDSDEADGAAAPSAAQPVAAPAAQAAAAAPSAPAAKQPPASRNARTDGGKIGARERRTPQTLEETLEILGANELAIAGAKGDTTSDTGVRH